MYLVIETIDNERQEYTHFIDLQNLQTINEDVRYLFRHLTYYPNQKPKKVYKTNTKLTNW